MYSIRETLWFERDLFSACQYFVILRSSDQDQHYSELQYAFCDGCMPFFGRDVEGLVCMCVNEVDQGLHAVCSQQRANRRCVTITFDILQMLPRHVLLAP
jgi:hypothetical protein